MSRRRQLFLKRILLFLVILFVWEATTGGFDPRWQIFNSALLARPSNIAVALVDYARSGLLLTDARQTLQEAFLGLFLGMIGGVVVGILFGYWGDCSSDF